MQVMGVVWVGGGGVGEGECGDGEGEAVHVCLVGCEVRGGGGGGGEWGFVGEEVRGGGGGGGIIIIVIIVELVLYLGRAEEGVGYQAAVFGEFLYLGLLI